MFLLVENLKQEKIQGSGGLLVIFIHPVLFFNTKKSVFPCHLRCVQEILGGEVFQLSKAVFSSIEIYFLEK